MKKKWSHVIAVQAVAFYFAISFPLSHCVPVKANKLCVCMCVCGGCIDVRCKLYDVPFHFHAQLFFFDFVCFCLVRLHVAVCRLKWH